MGAKVASTLMETLTKIRFILDFCLKLFNYCISLKLVRILKRFPCSYTPKTLSED